VKFTPRDTRSYTITAKYGGDDNHGSGSGTTVVDTPKDGTNTQVSCAPATVTAFSQTVCTATATGVGSGAPAITFKTNPVLAATALGTVTCAQLGSIETCTVGITIPSSGTYSVSAAYPGNALDGGSNGSTQLTVAAAQTSISASCSPSTIYDDQSSNCTATVSGLVGGATPPALTWTTNGTGYAFTGESCAVAASSETCSITFTPGEYGNYRIGADFPGDASALGGAGEVGLVVQSSVVLSCAGTDAWICTTTVTDHTASPSTPTGTVTLTYGESGGSQTGNGSCSLTAINGSSASCQVHINSIQSYLYTLKATYPGDGTHKAGSDTITYQKVA
jgi:hypothetical protein